MIFRGILLRMENLSLPTPYFCLFLWHLSAPYRLAPRVAYPLDWPWTCKWKSSFWHLEDQTAYTLEEKCQQPLTQWQSVTFQRHASSTFSLWVSPHARWPSEKVFTLEICCKTGHIKWKQEKRNWQYFYGQYYFCNIPYKQTCVWWEIFVVVAVVFRIKAFIVWQVVRFRTQDTTCKLQANKTVTADFCNRKPTVQVCSLSTCLSLQSTPSTNYISL